MGFSHMRPVSLLILLILLTCPSRAERQPNNTVDIISYHFVIGLPNSKYRCCESPPGYHQSCFMFREVCIVFCLDGGGFVGSSL